MHQKGFDGCSCGMRMKNEWCYACSTIHLQLEAPIATCQKYTMHALFCSFSFQFISSFSRSFCIIAFSIMTHALLQYSYDIFILKSNEAIFLCTKNNAMTSSKWLNGVENGKCKEKRK